MFSKRDVWSSLLFLILIAIISTYRVYGSPATVAVDPPVSNVNLGDVFSVNINVSNIANFTSWELKLYYQKTVVNCTSAVEGPFLKTGGGTFSNANITNNFNATHGRVLAYSTLLGMTSVNGSGVILVVTFKVVGGGITPLHLADIKLGDEKIPPQPIPYTAFDGTVQVSGAELHDVAVTNVVSLKKVVGQGFFNNITVTLQNQGGYSETFNVTVRANSTDIGRQEVTLPSMNTVSITFKWNSSGFPYSNNSISAYAWPVPGETDIDDNTFTDGRLLVSIPGDIKVDGKVNILDAIVLANAFMTRPGDSNWNPDADLQMDGVVNILDAIILANHFLEGT